MRTSQYSDNMQTSETSGTPQVRDTDSMLESTDAHIFTADRNSKVGVIQTVSQQSSTLSSMRSPSLIRDLVA